MSFLYVSGISIALFRIIILLTKPIKHVPDYLLAVLLFFSAQTIFNSFWVATGLYLQYPDVLVAGLNAPIAVACLFFLYTKYQTPHISFKPMNLLHFLPYLICSLLYVTFYFLPFQEKLALMQPGAANAAIELIRISVICLSGFVYFLWALWMLVRFRKQQQAFTSILRKHWCKF